MIAGLGFKASAAPFHMWTSGRLRGCADPGDGVHVGATKTVSTRN